jgi:hypothetical protein
MYESKKFKTQKKFENSCRDNFLFCHTGVKFFVIVWIYIYVKVEGSAFDKILVQAYSTIGEKLS